MRLLDQPYHLRSFIRPSACTTSFLWSTVSGIYRQLPNRGRCSSPSLSGCCSNPAVDRGHGQKHPAFLDHLHIRILRSCGS